MCNYELEDELKKFEFRCEIIERLVRKEIKRYKAARILNLSKRQITRLKKKYENGGSCGLVHGLKGIVKPKLFTGKMAKDVIGYYTGAYAIEHNDPSLDYSEYNFKQFYDELDFGSLSHLGHKLSYTTLYKGLTSMNIISPYKKRIDYSCDNKGANLEKTYHYGERLETDACEWDWFGDGNKYKAHVVYCRGYMAPISIWFEKQETTVGYLNAFSQVFENFGTPKQIISDRRGTFVNNKVKGTPEEYNTYFNKSIIIKNNIDYYFTSNPDAKGGVESCNRYIERNLPKEFKRLGIKTIEAANEYMTEYCEKRINVSAKTYKKQMQYRKNLFGEKFSKDKIRKEFICEESTVTVDKNGFIPYKGMQYLAIRNGKATKYKKKDKIKIAKNHLGDIFQVLPNSIIEIEHALSDNLKFHKKKVERLTKKISASSTLTFKGNEYVILKNNNYHLELLKGSEVELEHSENSLVIFKDKKCYKLELLKNYDKKELILPTKICKSRFDFTIGYNNTRYVIVTNEKKPLIIEESTAVKVTMHNYELSCFINGQKFGLIKYDEYESKTLLPKSKYLSKLIIIEAKSSQQVVQYYDDIILTNSSQ